MKFCQNCGAEINEGVNFCPKCGKASGATALKGQGQQNSNGAETNKVMAIIPYFGLLFCIPLLTGDYKKSEFVKYHTNQGIVLSLLTVIWSIVYTIIISIIAVVMGYNIFNIGLIKFLTFINILFGLLWFIPAILCVLGIIHAVKDEMKPLPVIGKIRIIK